MTLDFKPIRDESEPRDPRPNRALVMSSGKTMSILEVQGAAFQRGDVEPEDFEDIAPLGLHVFEGGWAQTGVESWEMPIPECQLVGTFRPATEAEVEAYLNDEYLWELPPPELRGEPDE